VISGIVLAAGTSSRLGSPKQLLELDGSPLLQHVIDALSASGVDEVVVVLGHEADRVGATLRFPPGVRTVFNPDHRSGQSTSLAAGLDALPADSDVAVIVLGDQPRLTTAAIRKVLDAFRASAVPIARAMWDGTPGHPVVAARSEWDRFRGVRGDTGARDVIAATPGVLEIEMGEGPPTDVDTWDQYRGLREE
jgi:molybdenum cofactor cytidylyltransferase